MKHLRTGINVRKLLFVFSTILVLGGVELAAHAGFFEGSFGTNPVRNIAPHYGSIIFTTNDTINNCDGDYATVPEDHPQKNELYALLLMSKAMQLPVYCVHESTQGGQKAECVIKYCEIKS